MRSPGRSRFIVLCVAPATILFFLFMVMPTFNVFRMSLFERGAYSPTETFVGLNNFKVLFRDTKFITSMQNTILLIVTVTVVTFFSAIYKPENGMLNSILSLLSGHEVMVLWKDQPMVIVSVIIAMVWQAIGYYMVMYMASMSAVPVDLYESASLDGAGRLSQFFEITLPLIWTNIRTTLTFFIISTINMAFLFVKAMVAKGMADVGLSFMYAQKDEGLYGYAMAAGVVIFLFSFALSAVVNQVTRRDVLQM